MKKLFALLISAILALSLAACDRRATEKPSYVVNFTNHSTWTLSGNAAFYDLSGAKVAEAPVQEGKAAADLADGTYIVQLTSAPDAVDFELAILTSAEKKATVVLTDSEFAEESGYIFTILVVALQTGTPLSGYQVIVCYEPEGDEIGYCLEPVDTDARGVISTVVNPGRFHVSVTPPQEVEPIYDGYGDISAAHRFFIASAA